MILQQYLLTWIYVRLEWQRKENARSKIRISFNMRTRIMVHVSEKGSFSLQNSFQHVIFLQNCTCVFALSLVTHFSVVYLPWRKRSVLVCLLTDYFAEHDRYIILDFVCSSFTSFFATSVPIFKRSLALRHFWHSAIFFLLLLKHTIIKPVKACSEAVLPHNRVENRATATILTNT